MTSPDRHVAPNAARFEPLAPERLEQWKDFPLDVGHVLFPGHLGFQLEEVRTDYSRLRMPYRREHSQLQGVLHGGAIASLVDTCVVPAIGSAYEERRAMLTLDMHVSYLGSIREEDAIGEGWVERRGKSIVFCRAEVRSASGDLTSTGSIIYKVGGPLPR